MALKQWFAFNLTLQPMPVLVSFSNMILDTQLNLRCTSFEAIKQDSQRGINYKPFLFLSLSLSLLIIPNIPYGTEL